MSERPEELSELRQRVERMEGWVNWLIDQEKKRGAVPGQAAASAAAPVAAATPSGMAPTPPVPISKPKTPPPPKEKKERNPAVIIGAIGAGIFLLGIIFFLAVSLILIGPELRFLLGLFTGAGITAFASRLVLRGTRKLGICLLVAGLGTLQFSCYVGAFTYDFFSPTFGLLAVAIISIFTGALAGRVKSAGTFLVAYLSAFLAPFIFSTGSHNVVALSIYMLVLGFASLALPYLSKVGGRWSIVRWITVLSLWGLLGGIASDFQVIDAKALFLLVGAHYLVTGLWIWLPKYDAEKPSSPTLLWFIVSLAMTSISWFYWKALGWPATWFSLMALLFAAVNIALVRPLRARFGSRQADLGLLVLAAGHLSLAIPIALEWRWVGLLWGAFALGLAWACEKAEHMREWEEEEQFNLRLLALGMALLASVRWVWAGAQHWFAVFESTIPETAKPPILNGVFALSLLLCAAWFFLSRRKAPLNVLGFLALEAIGNISLAFEAAYLLRWMNMGERSANVIITLVWTLSGAIQWLRGINGQRNALNKALEIVGYLLLAVASMKLIFIDMTGTNPALRALAFLAVGGIFLVAALIANQVKQHKMPEAP
jgi:uncharacterized membrane protein